MRAMISTSAACSNHASSSPEMANGPREPLTLITHSAFCLSETALDIEGVLTQVLLRRGAPKTIVVDNGAAYRAATLQGICARLSMRLVYCRPYAPQGKGKLERWHRTLRDQFLAELDTTHIRELADLNARLWACLSSSEYTRGVRRGALTSSSQVSDMLEYPENGTWTPFHSASRLCPDHATRSRETANGLVEVLTRT